MRSCVRVRSANEAREIIQPETFLGRLCILVMGSWNTREWQQSGEGSESTRDRHHPPFPWVSWCARLGQGEGVMGETGEEGMTGSWIRNGSLLLGSLVSIEFKKKTACLCASPGKGAALFGVSPINACCPPLLKKAFTPLVTGNVPKMYIISQMGEHQFHRT